MKLLFILITTFCFNLSNAQNTKDFVLSESESLEFINSVEFQKVISIQNEFLDLINKSNSTGVSIKELEKLAIDQINGNSNSFNKIIFGSVSEGEDFYKSVTISKSNLINKYPFIKLNQSTFICEKCLGSSEEQVSYFFKNFETFNKYRFTIIESERMVPCGSYWNAAKLGICSGLCGASTAGLGAVACGWGCWCTFCTQNSAVANVICAN